MATTIYRGFDIVPEPGGIFRWADLDGLVSKHSTEDEAMNAIDRYKRKLRADATAGPPSQEN